MEGLDRIEDKLDRTDDKLDRVIESQAAIFADIGHVKGSIITINDDNRKRGERMGEFERDLAVVKNQLKTLIDEQAERKELRRGLAKWVASILVVVVAASIISYFNLR